MQGGGANILEEAARAVAWAATALQAARTQRALRAAVGHSEAINATASEATAKGTEDEVTP